MDTTTIVLLVALGYLFLRSGGLSGFAGVRPGGPTYYQRPGAGGTQISIPGFGGYASGPGGTFLQLDPRLFNPQGTGTADLTSGIGMPAFPSGPVSTVYDPLTTEEILAGEAIYPDIPASYVDPVTTDPCFWMPVDCAGSWDFGGLSSVY